MSDEILKNRAVDVTVNGKEYTLSPLTMEEMAEFQRISRRLRMKEFLSTAIEINMPEAAISATIRSIEADRSVDSKVSTTFSEEGICWLIWKSISKTDPKIQLSDVSFSVEELDRLVYLAMYVSTGKLPEEIVKEAKEVGGENPT